MHLILAALFALCQLKTGKYIFSALTTLVCAAVVLPNAPVLALALFVSFIGDYFMAHKEGKEWMYLLGIAGFFCAHAVFIVHALTGAHHVKAGLLAGAAMAIWFTPYLILRVIRNVPKLLKAPVVLYTLISIVGLACAVMTGSIPYILAIAMLLFSDTMIAENDFVGNRKAGPLILPTYYLCHILAALSALI